LAASFAVDGADVQLPVDAFAGFFEVLCVCGVLPLPPLLLEETL
jgi:hypothetical protein